MNGNFAADLQAVFTSHGSRPALRTADGEAWAYSDLAERTARLAAVLNGVGMAPGDRVLAQVGKSPEAVALYLATLQVGGVYVPLNSAYTAGEVGVFCCRCATAGVRAGPSQPSHGG